VVFVADLTTPPYYSRQLVGRWCRRAVAFPTEGGRPPANGVGRASLGL